MLPDDTALNAEFGVQPVNVVPPERQGFRDAKSKADAHESDSAEWLLQMRRELLKLGNAQATRVTYSLACSLDRYQFHRITLRGYIPAPLRKIPQSIEQPSNLHLG